MHHLKIRHHITHLAFIVKTLRSNHAVRNLFLTHRLLKTPALHIRAEQNGDIFKWNFFNTMQICNFMCNELRFLLVTGH